MSQKTTDTPLYHDVAPEYERYTRFFLILAGLASITAVICTVIKAQDEKKFYIIIINIVASLLFTVCIHLFFKRRILLAEKLWLVNVTILMLLIQGVIYSIFVFTTHYYQPILTTMRTSTPFTMTTTPFNRTNMTNITTTTRPTTTTTVAKNWRREDILTMLYELTDE